MDSVGPPFSVPLFSLQEKLGVLIYTYITNNQTKYRVGIYMYMDNNAVTCLFWLQYWGGGGGYFAVLGNKSCLNLMRTSWSEWISGLPGPLVLL